jgi:hypothetical protein
MLKNFSKKILIVILSIFILLIVIAFFYPKVGGYICGFCPLLHRIEYGCIGFKQVIYPKPTSPSIVDRNIPIICYGIVTGEKKCYNYMNEEIPCEIFFSE